MKRCVLFAFTVLMSLGALSCIVGLAESDDDWKYTVHRDGTAVITGYTGSQQDLMIPAFVGGYPVTEISFQGLAKTLQIDSVIIPEGVIKISDRAFEEFDCLEKVRLPSSLRSIGAYSFSFSGVRSISLPEGLETIYGEAFSASELQSIYLSSTIQHIYGNPFVYCSNLNAIYVSPENQIFESYDGCLYNEREHRLICFPHEQRHGRCEIMPGTKIIGQEAFAYTEQDPYLAISCQVYLPEGVTTLEYYAFAYSDGIDIWLPASLTRINEYAFYSQLCGPRLHVISGTYAESFCIQHGLDYETYVSD